MTIPGFDVPRAGVLLHPTSLPSRLIDGDVERWIDLIASAGFKIWQMLPLGEPHSDLSPYQCMSAFAMNPGLLDHYPELNTGHDDYHDFCLCHSYWLNDYALFALLKKQYSGIAWYNWPDEFKFRDQKTIDDMTVQYVSELDLIKWQQYQLFSRWQMIRHYASDRGIQLFGDMPIFVAHDSADVWAHPELFLLDNELMPTFVAGVPPDYFSETGQRWGNPHYDWDHMKQEGFSWWLSRLHYHFDLFDLIRIDHFRGFDAVWMIDAKCETAIDGHWENVHGDDLLSLLDDGLYQSIVAEDLGIITDPVIALRKKYNFPGMAVLQFAFDGSEDNPHRPENIQNDCVVYTGTHDNDTTRGWCEKLPASSKDLLIELFKLDADFHCLQLVDMMIDSALKSRALICILTLQDLLYLDSSSRMNIPGTVENNWRWSFNWSDLPADFVDVNLSRLQLTGRTGDCYGK
ncbi:MAG: 4-alpha-glucanotransferase [Gammaproteobacteria bacterium]|nr:4-alpha-glucanotransferase [Gammaproteobacteria bacterium]MDH5734939.1 4-alpha-glucanotransferase [Gammaproteobacteria bacterium]